MKDVAHVVERHSFRAAGASPVNGEEIYVIVCCIADCRARLAVRVGAGALIDPLAVLYQVQSAATGLAERALGRVEFVARLDYHAILADSDERNPLLAAAERFESGFEGVGIADDRSARDECAGVPEVRIDHGGHAAGGAFQRRSHFAEFPERPCRRSGGDVVRHRQHEFHAFFFKVAHRYIDIGLLSRTQGDGHVGFPDALAYFVSISIVDGGDMPGGAEQGVHVGHSTHRLGLRLWLYRFGFP